MTVRTAHWLRVGAACLIALVVAEGRAQAQAQAPSQSQRGGFTVRVNFGVGIANLALVRDDDPFVERDDFSAPDVAVGCACESWAVGGFLTTDLALMFRIVGTTVFHDISYRDTTWRDDQFGGMGGLAAQYWISDRFNVEAGLGVGLVETPWETYKGLGLILGTGMTIFNRGKHNLQIGIEYAPTFTDPRTVHNLGFTFGYQFL